MKKNTVSYVSGVGGWLALLIAILMAIGPLLGFGNLYGTLSDAQRQYPELAMNTRWATYVQVTWALFAGFMAIGIAAGYRLWKIHTKDSIRFATIALWLVGPVSNISHSINSAIALNKPLDSGNIASLLGEAAASCIIAAFWTMYLRRSIRVQNTYK